MILNYCLYAFLGLLPSLLWLFFYLRQDVHPEPKKEILLVFLGGALMGPIAVLLQMAALKLCAPEVRWPNLLAALGQNQNLFLLNVLLFAPLTEEFLKYSVVRWRILKNPAFDEPLDAMIYLIVSALGFAATENMLNIFFLAGITPKLALAQASARFLSATLLHTLASGLLGYFIAYSLIHLKYRRWIFLSGLLLAVTFHSVYDYLAWLLESNDAFLFLLIALLALMALIVRWQFHYLKKRLAICRFR